jgi:hypothetical protein
MSKTSSPLASQDQEGAVEHAAPHIATRVPGDYRDRQSRIADIQHVQAVTVIASVDVVATGIRHEPVRVVAVVPDPERGGMRGIAHVH